MSTEVLPAALDPNCQLCGEWANVPNINGTEATWHLNKLTLTSQKCSFCRFIRDMLYHLCGYDDYAQLHSLRIGIKQIETDAGSKTSSELRGQKQKMV